MVPRPIIYITMLISFILLLMFYVGEANANFCIKGNAILMGTSTWLLILYFTKAWDDETKTGYPFLLAFITWAACLTATTFRENSVFISAELMVMVLCANYLTIYPHLKKHQASDD
jgi:hypothetical protein